MTFTKLTDGIDPKIQKICEDLKIIVKEDCDIRSGRWRGDREILINPESANTYTYLHEIGHVLAGYMCCREHCEYAAHGAAIGLAAAYNIKLEEADLRKIDGYAGRTLQGGCGAIAQRDIEE